MGSPRLRAETDSIRRHSSCHRRETDGLKDLLRKVERFQRCRKVFPMSYAKT